MIDLKALRDNPDRYRQGAANKNYDPTLVDRLLSVDSDLREMMSQQQKLTAEKNEIGKKIGMIAGKLKKASDDEKASLQTQMKDLQARPNEIKQIESELVTKVSELEAARLELWLQVPQPADDDVPVGKTADDNVQISTWGPDWFSPGKSFQENKGFAPKTHMELGEALGLFEFERGVKMAGSRSYVLCGDGMRLHNAILRYAFDFMTNENGFKAMSVPVMVRYECMEGTGFFPSGRDQAYDIGNPTGEGYSLHLTGTGEVGLMGYHMGEILDEDQLPIKMTTVSTCFRREAGAAGKDTRGLYRIHQFDKVEQVVICKADETESRNWHKNMLGFVQELLKRLELPHRLLQCCTGDLGPKNADMIDVECWMPSRGEVAEDGSTSGDWGETHSASRLYDYQCRRLNLRYRDKQTNKTVVCHALNNTVAASPRILIPIMEMYQNADGTITIPEVLRPYMGGDEKIG
ncbi:MAG TPA: serine--tRNA ligase [Phycisphaerales bacterium]|nr:serine--tRNA ligase [Phycisphaerales bacterium]HCD35256.1 serine--tRNA ligase [Phycisphaerales bacterium]|tara:strand:- start:2941 stop:4329 length:1389 start_codon:yes stop_codon:yes gene_type:complete